MQNPLKGSYGRADGLESEKELVLILHEKTIKVVDLNETERAVTDRQTRRRASRPIRLMMHDFVFHSHTASKGSNQTRHCYTQIKERTRPRRVWITQDIVTHKLRNALSL